MHRKRWLSGLIMAPGLILFVLFAPAWLFLLLVLSLVWLGMREYYSLSLPDLGRGERFLGLGLGFLLPLAFYGRNPQLFTGALTFSLFLFFLLALGSKEEFPVRVGKLGRHLLGLLYISFLLAHLVLMRQLEDGKTWILFTLVAVFFSDTMAFYVGRTWGRKKLAPILSPGKTVEGLAGAVAGSVVGALLFEYFFLPTISIVYSAALGAGIGIIGQLGDLCESMLKRSARAKDSGKLIPGHGGLLDRIDSVLFSVPFVYYLSCLAGY